MRGIIGELHVGAGITVVDMEAGLELFGRGTPGPSDILVIVIEPSLWSIQTATRIAELARELGIPKVVAVANKVREEVDVAWIREAIQPHGVAVIGSIPYDPAVSAADRQMRSLLDLAPDCEAAQAVRAVVAEIEAAAGVTAAPAPDGSQNPSGQAVADDGCPWVVDKY